MGPLLSGNGNTLYCSPGPCGSNTELIKVGAGLKGLIREECESLFWLFYVLAFLVNVMFEKSLMFTP